MDFGADEDQMSRFFADYPMRLFCVNEEADVSVFKTELRELFRILQFRSNRQELKKLMQQNPEYRHLDEETSEVVAAMLNAPEIWENRERYMNQEKEEFNMCRALQEWAEEERTEGRAEGIAEAREVGIRILIENCKELGASEKVAVRQVMKKYEVEEEAAEDYVKQHWK